MGRTPNRDGERGSIAPLFLVTVSMLLIMGWTMAGVASTHFLRAAHQSQDILAGQLAKAGLAAAMVEIDEIKEGDSSSLPPSLITGSEATGQYRVSITPTDRGTYTVTSTATARNRTRQLTAEVAPPPEPFALLSGGNVSVSHGTLASLGGDLEIVGDLNAGGNVSLDVGSALLSVSSDLKVRGDVRAGGDANLKARAGLLVLSGIDIYDELSAGRDVTFDTKDLVLLSSATINVKGPVSYGGKINGKNEDGVHLDGGIRKVDDVIITPLREASVAEFEARVRELEKRGELEAVLPGKACGTIKKNTRVLGNLKCVSLRVEDSAFVVVDGYVDVTTATVNGTLYVRGGSTPNPNGWVDIDTLALLELIGHVDPMKGSGVIVATGDVEVGKSGLATLLSLISGKRAVLQVMAISTGDDDHNNDIEFGLGGVLKVIKTSKAAPLFLYAADDGDITIKLLSGISAVDIEPQPLVAVAGGSITVDSNALLEALSEYRIEAWPEIWDLVPPSLQGLGRARVIAWEWTDA